jgi:hypothetical protein
MKDYTLATCANYMLFKINKKQIKGDGNGNYCMTR